MVKSNNKAFTVVELLITFVLVMTLTIGLFKVVDSYRNKQQKELYRKEIASYRDQLVRIIQDDLNKLKITSVETIDVGDTNKCNGKCNSNYNEVIRINGSKYLGIKNTKGSTIGGVLYGTKFYEFPNKYIYVPEDWLYFQNSADEDLATTAFGYTKSGETYNFFKVNKSIYPIGFKLKHEELKEEFDFNVVAIKRTKIGDNIPVTVSSGNASYDTALVDSNLLTQFKKSVCTYLKVEESVSKVNNTSC